MDYEVQDNQIAKLTFKERQHLRTLWTDELTEIEDVIVKVKKVLRCKKRKRDKLKKKLYCSSGDTSQGIDTRRDSNMQYEEYEVGQVTESATDAPYKYLHSLYEKTTAFDGTIINKISRNLHSVSETVGSTYENMKTRENLHEASSGTRPVTPEEKPLGIFEKRLFEISVRAVKNIL